MEGYLGIDIGSISTKGVVIDRNNNILASCYLYTKGDPVGAVKEVISNLKNDKSNIIIKDKEVFNTNLKKFGTIIGSNVDIGCNSVIFPGTIIKNGVSVYPLTRVRGIIEENSIVKDENNIVKKY